MTDTLSIRAARAGDADALTELALRSKAVWGYDRAFMTACRAELTVTAELIARSAVRVAAAGDAIRGFYALTMERPEPSLEFLYVEPDFIGTGVGARLWKHAVGEARARSLKRFSIDADPNAEAFYLSRGCERTGEVPSGSIPGRKLPLLSYVL